MIQVTMFGKTYKVAVEVAQYSNGLSAISLIEEDMGPFATLSVNLQDVAPDMVSAAKALTDADQRGFIAKLYSENEGLEQLLEYPAFEQVGDAFTFGPFGTKAALWTFNPSKLDT